MLEKKANQKRDCRAPKGLAMTNGKTGSALIMTVVLTVLLAIVAVMFVMVARMDSASTSNIVDSKTLDNAAKSIIEIIGKELVLDTPGVANQEYQDYPDVNDAWLANIEPDASGTEWRQISDVTGYLKSNNYSTQNILTDPPGSWLCLPDYPEIKPDKDGNLDKTYYTTNNIRANADADGDGIADSKWIELAGINSSKGKKVFAAIRVIDNCAMLNVNTAYKFDDTTTVSSDRFRVDGTSQLQINLNGLLKSKAGKNDDIDKFHNARCGGDSALAADDSDGWNDYDNRVSWKYDSPPSGNYLPFDISDELELRYRYCIDSKFASRIETDANMPATIRGAGLPDFGNLYNDNWGLPDWKNWIPETGRALEDSDRRHLLTTYSFDRLIDPNGEKMFYVRSGGDAQWLYDGLVGAIDKDLPSADQDELKDEMAQIAANIVDYADADSNISVVSVGSNDFYGYEPPFMFISEVARNFKRVPDPNGNQSSTVVRRSYAVELYKNFDNNDIFTDDWRLTVGSESPILLQSTDFYNRGGQYYVLIYNDPNADMNDMVDFTDSPQNGAANVSPNVTLRWPVYRISDPCDGNSYDATAYMIHFGQLGSLLTARELITDANHRSWQPSTGHNGEILVPGKTYQWRVDGYLDTGGATPIIRTGDVWEFTVGNPQPEVRSAINSLGNIKLERKVGPDWWITVDMVTTNELEDANLLDVKTRQRDMRWDVYLKANWSNALSSATLGWWNGYDSNDPNPIPSWHHHFTTAGDAAMVFRKSTYFEGAKTPSGHILGLDSNADDESEVRFDPYCPSMQNVFKYITAMNPDNYASNDANETRVRGRININTAPAFVISQLPWVSKANRKDLKIADAIVAYRDMAQLKASDGSIILDYTDRQTATGLLISKYKIREAPGFSSIGELMNVINKDNKIDYDIRYCGIDNGKQYGFPDLTFDSRSMTDDAENDLEEKELIFARISDLATVRSDTFTAYILVRVGVDGPQKRFIAILDRTGVKQPTDKIKVEAFQQVPAAR